MKTIGTSQSGAIFSDCGKFRYRLWRKWSDGPRALFQLLNPSKAGAVDGDHTVDRQIERVRRWTISGKQFGSLEVVNACGLISTDPRGLDEADDPIGPDNAAQVNHAIAAAVLTGGIIIAGWGSNLPKYLPEYAEQLRANLAAIPYCAFKLNDDGHPCHPLYLPYDLLPKRWVGRALLYSAVDLMPAPETRGLFDGVAPEGGKA